MAEGDNKVEPKWTDGFDDAVKGYVEKKGFKNPGDLAHSYMNLEKLHAAGPDKLLKLPDSMDSPEAMAVWDRLGRPKDPKEYGLDPKLVGEHLASEFHEVGVTKDQATKLVAKQIERQKAMDAKLQEDLKSQLAQQDLDLKKEWGNAYDQNRNIVDSAAKTLGLSQDEIQAMGKTLGMDKAMKMLLSLGVKTGEHNNFTKGEPAGTGVLTPEQGIARINELKSDSTFIEKFLKGDGEARKQWDLAHRMAYPGEISL